MAEHKGVVRARQYVELFHRGDFEAMRHFYAEDVVWHVGGRHGLSGDHRGIDAVFEYFARVRQLTGGTLRLAPETILASDRHTVMFTRVTAQRGLKHLAVDMVEVLRVEPDGRWAEYWATASDAASVSAFWS